LRMWLRNLRKICGLSQEALAQKIGVERAVVSQWESGSRRPTYNNMCLLEDILGPEVLEQFSAEVRAKHQADVHAKKSQLESQPEPPEAA